MRIALFALLALGFLVGCESKPDAAKPNATRRRVPKASTRLEAPPANALGQEEPPGGHGAGVTADPSVSPKFAGTIGTGPEATAQIVPPTTPLSERAELLAGWISLYDGYTLYGWTPQSEANWKIEGGAITASEGKPGLLTTNSEFGDYHLRVDYRAEKGTNSGVFLHTSEKPGPNDVTTKCYEVNIAPDSNPFPTGSIVGRVKANQSIKEDVWHSLEAKVQGGRVMVFVDGALTADYTDPRPLGRGKIGLQFNQGEISFRQVNLRPLGLGVFGEEGGISGWKLDSNGKTAVEIGAEGDFRLRGGKGFLESEKSFKDFVLQVEARTNHEGQNSGIFFRTIPGSDMDGYECQINNAAKQGKPVDCGTGGIFRRQDARLMPAADGRWFALTIICQGPHMACWVNGLQVSDWTDDRPEDPNPRKGKRLEGGVFMLQGHDAMTDVNFRQFRVSEMAARSEAAPPAD